MYLGVTLIGIGIVWYIVHTIIYNYYLSKNAPGLLEQSKPAKSSDGRKGRRAKKTVKVVVTENTTPAWVAILGLPPIPVFLLGVLILIVATIINLFSA